MDELADRGILLRKVGSGTYVNPEKWGLQSYTVLNWQLPAALSGKTKNDEYSLKAGIQRNKAQHKNIQIWDLSRDDLPADLLPAITIPELAWRDVIRAEQGDEASHLGLSSFRHTVRAFLGNCLGLDVPYEQILITSGTQQAIFLLTQCLLRPGDAIGVELPSYFYSLPIFQAAGLRLYALPMDDEGVTVEGLDSLMLLRPLKMVFLNPMFHNPTGTCISTRRKQDILRCCSMKRIPIVEDDAYSLLAFSRNTDTAPIKKYDNHNQVIYAGSLSSYAGRNLRAGWMVAPESVIGQLAEVRRQVDAGLSVLPQLLARHYIDENLPPHRERLRRVLAQRAEKLASWLANRYGDKICFKQPQGGLYLYATLKEKNITADRKFLQDLLRENIILARGVDFGDSAGTFRMNFGQFNDA